MTVNKQIIDAKPVLDEHGFIDLNHYYMEAEKMRAEYISAIFADAANKIKKLVSTAFELVTCPKCLFSH